MAATMLDASVALLSQSLHLHSSWKTLPSSFKCNLQYPYSQYSLLSPLSTTKNHPAPAVARIPKSSRLYSSPAQGTALETPPEETQPGNKRRKLYVSNLPWSVSVDYVKDMFGQCGTVSDVEFIKQKDGKGRNFAFVTMASGEEAQAVVDKFNSQEVAGRIIRVEFAKRFKKPSSKPVPSTPVRVGETRHQLYVSNLAWKVRGIHLRDFFSESFKPVSSRVVFDSPSGRSAGYGFVSFATREEAEAALSAYDGKELMGRPLRLKLNEERENDTGNESRGENSSKTEAEEQ